MKRITLVIGVLVVALVGAFALRAAVETHEDPLVIVHWSNSHPMRDGLLPQMAEQFNDAHHETSSGRPIEIKLVACDSEILAKDLVSRVKGSGPIENGCQGANPTIVTPQADDWLVDVNSAARSHRGRPRGHEEHRQDLGRDRDVPSAWRNAWAGPRRRSATPTSLRCGNNRRAGPALRRALCAVRVGKAAVARVHESDLLDNRPECLDLALLDGGEPHAGRAHAERCRGPDGQGLGEAVPASGRPLHARDDPAEHEGPPRHEVRPLLPDARGQPRESLQGHGEGNRGRRHGASASTAEEPGHDLPEGRIGAELESRRHRRGEVGLGGEGCGGSNVGRTFCATTRSNGRSSRVASGREPAFPSRPRSAPSSAWIRPSRRRRSTRPTSTLPS